MPSCFRAQGSDASYSDGTWHLANHSRVRTGRLEPRGKERPWASCGARRDLHEWRPNCHLEDMEKPELCTLLKGKFALLVGDSTSQQLFLSLVSVMHGQLSRGYSGGRLDRATTACGLRRHAPICCSGPASRPTCTKLNNAMASIFTASGRAAPPWPTWSCFRSASILPISTWRQWRRGAPMRQRRQRVSPYFPRRWSTRYVAPGQPAPLQATCLTHSFSWELRYRHPDALASKNPSPCLSSWRQELQPRKASLVLGRTGDSCRARTTWLAGSPQT